MMCAKMADVKPTRSVADILSCCLCMELYDSTVRLAKGLPCQHTYCACCAPCLDRLYETSTSTKHQRCPTSKAVFVFPGRGASSLLTNFTVQELVEVLESEQQQQKEEQDKPPTPRCVQHDDRPVLMVCHQCAAGLCTECLKALPWRGEHRAHDLEDLDTYLASIASKRAQLTEQLDEVLDLVKREEKEHERSIQEEKRQTSIHIDEEAEKAIEE